MNAYASSRAARWAMLPLLVTALLACTGGDLSNAQPARQLATAAPAETAAGVQGLGKETAEGAITDTIHLRDLGYSRGSADAPVVVYEFADFGCPFCGMFARSTYPELHKEFVETGKVRWTYIPVTFGFPGGAEGAVAAECAAEQQKFWEMHDLLFQKQSEWKNERDRERLLPGYAEQIGLDVGAFLSCYRASGGRERLVLNNHAADALHLRATPSFLINGRLVEGALPIEQFRQILTMLGGER
ncbi:MAG TPA: thioredoxin domain-containing protein [Longimicrobiaceae bacterium]|nr:thioredoxin domain-containing protein [Longimicrobiaceae bacterium]